jgi:hypothetical protein
MIVAFLGVIAIPWFANFFALTTVGLNAPTGVAVAVGAVGAGLVWVATLVTDRWRRA